MGVGEEGERRALNQRHIASLFPQPHLVPIDKQFARLFTREWNPPAPDFLIDRGWQRKIHSEFGGDYGEDGVMTGTDFGGPIVGEWNALYSHSAHTALVKGSSGPKSRDAERR